MCGYFAVFPTFGFILLCFIENPPSHIDIGVLLKLLQRQIQNSEPIQTSKMELYAKVDNLGDASQSILHPFLYQENVLLSY